jgi:cysteine-rich repeat protein
MLKCGNGVIEPGEQCDRGVAGNTSGYGGCNPDCTLGPYCGDAVVQNPPEQCDYGIVNNTGGYGGCNSNCTLGPYCGDGIVQNPEQCDNGANNVVPVAAYGMGVCTIACMPAPFCGDGIVEMQFGEQCDGTTDCNPMCQFLIPK